MKRLLFGILTLLFLGAGYAHGPIHEKIEEVNQRIEKDPLNAFLYLERSSYYKIDGNFDKAMADLVHARNLQSDILTIDFLAAELCYAFEHYHLALSYANVFQKSGISLDQTYVLKAQILDKLFMSDSAFHYMELAYPLQERYTTAFFKMASEFSLYAQKDNYERAAAWLALGKRHLPYDCVLQEEYVQLALKFEDYEKAADLCLEQIPKLKRKESWHYKLAQVYTQANQNVLALEQLKLALAAVDKLPRHFRSTDYIKNLRRDINYLTEEIEQNNES